MPVLQLTDQQVIDLVKQLGPEQQRMVYEFLLRRQWPEWFASASYFEEGARRAAAERGRDWDTMTEGEREDFVDDIVHEDHRCVS